MFTLDSPSGMVPSAAPLTHPKVGLVFLPIEQILERNAAIGDEDVGRDGSVVKDSKSERLGVLDALLEVLVPDGIERLLPGGGLGDVGVVDVDGHIGVHQLVVGRLAERHVVALRAVRRP